MNRANDTMKWKWGRKGAAMLLGLALAFNAAGCGDKPKAGDATNPPQASGSDKTDGKTGTGAASAKATVYPFKVKDATGQEFTFDKAPARIVSVSPSETEMLFALGLGDKVVGVSDYDDYPAEATKKPKMGSIIKPNEEALIAANADIVLSGVSLPVPAVEKLRSLKVAVFKVEPKTIEDVMNNITMFGQMFDKQEQAEKLVASMKADRQKVVEAVKNVKPEQKKRVFIEFSPGWTVGKGEFMDELITLSGGVNVASDVKGFAKMDEEKVITENPQVILYPNNLIDEKSKKSLDQIIKERSSWSGIDAIKNNKIVGLDQNLISRPGPRITQALLEVAKGIYPELVK